MEWVKINNIAINTSKIITITDIELKVRHVNNIYNLFKEIDVPDEIIPGLMLLNGFVHDWDYDDERKEILLYDNDYINNLMDNFQQ